MWAKLIIFGLKLLVVLAQSDFDPTKVTFYLYRLESKGTPYQLLPGNASNLEAADFDPLLRTYFFIHGYASGYRNPAPQLFKDGVLAAESTSQVILVDYALYSLPYNSLYAKRYNIAEACSTMINDLINIRGLNTERLVIAGHSFGGQLTSFTARGVKDKVNRIVALDPAKPYFEFAAPADRLNPEDAVFVDCIYSSHVLGIDKPICGVNFFANGGRYQPKCANAGDNEVLFGICSHQLAVNYFVETLADPEKYPAYICFGDPRFEKHCAKSINMFMYSSSTRRPLFGNYYVPIPS